MSDFSVTARCNQCGVTFAPSDGPQCDCQSVLRCPYCGCALREGETVCPNCDEPIDEEVG